MATEDTASVVATPRIDRQFTDGRGNLTMQAYALLDGLIRRTGGPVGSVINIPNIDAAFADLNAQLQAFGVRVDEVESETEALEILPAPSQHAPTIEHPDGRIASLEAQIQAITQQVNALLLR